MAARPSIACGEHTSPACRKGCGSQAGPLPGRLEEESRGGLCSPTPAQHPQPCTLCPLQAPEPGSETHEVDFLLPGAFCTQCKGEGDAVDRAPHIDSTVAALGQLEERQGIPDCGRSPLNGTAKGLRGQAGCCWLAASSSLGHLGPRPSRETPRLRPASGLCAWSQWRGGGSGMAAIMSSWPGLPRVSLQPERCCRMAGDCARSG